MQRLSWLNLSLLSKPTQTNTLVNFIGLQQAKYFFKFQNFYCSCAYYLGNLNFLQSSEFCSLKWSRNRGMFTTICVDSLQSMHNTTMQKEKLQSRREVDCWTSEREKILFLKGRRWFYQQKVPLHYRVLTRHFHCVPYQDSFLHLQGDYAFHCAFLLSLS